MSDKQSKDIIDENISIIRSQINAKQSNTPHFVSINETQKIITDFDHFPYNRFYRGIYYSKNPIIIEREAGWRPLQNECYKPTFCFETPEYPNNCFEGSCNLFVQCQSSPKYNNYDNVLKYR